MDINDISLRFLRQLDYANPMKFRYSVSILGVGAIGSPIAIGSAKIGTPKGIKLIDPDVFELQNVPLQLCLEKSHLKKNKAQALAELCGEMGSIGPIKAYPHRLVKDSLVGSTDLDSTLQARNEIKGIVISTPDNMQARKDLWNLVKMNVDTPYLIDARMAGQYLQVIAVDTFSSDAVKFYESNLFLDSEASPEPCSARGNIYTSFFAGSIVLSIIKKMQMGEPFWREVRVDIPRLELTITLSNGKVISNKTELALATLD